MKLEESLNQGHVGPTQTILLVEDDSNLASRIRTELEANGYRINVVSIAESTDIARTNEAVMLILDRLRSDPDCLHFLEFLRNQKLKIPVLVISALASTEEVVRILNVGADGYLPKPFHMVELVAKVDALIRRLGSIQTTKLTVGDLEIDLIDRKASRSGVAIILRPTEYRLLEYFLRHPGQLITREMLLRDVWQYEFGVGSNVIDVQISNLRTKIDERGRRSRIANIRGQGFMLRPRI